MESSDSDRGLGARDKILCGHFCTKARIDYQRGDYNRAIKQARKAIKVDTNAVEAYKIIANALAKMGDHEAVTRLVEKARQRLSGPQPVQHLRTDPMRRLNMDTQVQMLSYLPFRELVKCMRVSKTWHNIITSDNAAHLWKHLNTYYPECVKLPRITPEFVKSCIRYAQKGCRQGVTSATLNCPGSHDTILKLLMLNCKNLEKLVLIRAEFSSTRLISVVSKMLNLTTLFLSAQVQISPDTLPQIFQHAPHLVDVQISGIRTVIGGTRLLQWHSKATKLKKLRLGIPGNRTDIRDFNMVTTLRSQQ
jgi:F-box/TPR repeat protein Pof3